MTEIPGNNTAWRAELGLTIELPDRIQFRDEESARLAIEEALAGWNFRDGLIELIRKAIGRQDAKFDWLRPFLTLTPATLERMELDHLDELVEIVPHRKNHCERLTYHQRTGRLTIWHKGKPYRPMRLNQEKRYEPMKVSREKFAVVAELVDSGAASFADLMHLAETPEEIIFNPLGAAAIGAELENIKLMEAGSETDD